MNCIFYMYVCTCTCIYNTVSIATVTSVGWGWCRPRANGSTSIVLNTGKVMRVSELCVSLSVFFSRIALAGMNFSLNYETNIPRQVVSYCLHTIVIMIGLLMILYTHSCTKQNIDLWWQHILTCTCTCRSWHWFVNRSCYYIMVTCVIVVPILALSFLIFPFLLPLPPPPPPSPGSGWQ